MHRLLVVGIFTPAREGMGQVFIDMGRHHSADEAPIGPREFIQQTFDRYSQEYSTKGLALEVTEPPRDIVFADRAGCRGEFAVLQDDNPRIHPMEAACRLDQGFFGGILATAPPDLLWQTREVLERMQQSVRLCVRLLV